VHAHQLDLEPISIVGPTGLHAWLIEYSELEPLHYVFVDFEDLLVEDNVFAYVFCVYMGVSVESCVCVCMYVYVCVGNCAHVDVLLCARVRVCMMYVCMMHVYECTCVRICVCI
jgi:hypothetical protein